MDLGDLIKPDAVIANLRARSKKALFPEIAARAGELLKIDGSLIQEAVWRREMLSSTGIGRGINRDISRAHCICYCRIGSIGRLR